MSKPTSKQNSKKNEPLTPQLYPDLPDKEQWALLSELLNKQEGQALLALIKFQWQTAAVLSLELQYQEGLPNASELTNYRKGQLNALKTIYTTLKSSNWERKQRENLNKKDADPNAIFRAWAEGKKYSNNMSMGNNVKGVS